jgi:hypothetical protein
MNHAFTRVLALVTSSVLSVAGASAQAEPIEPPPVTATAVPVEIVLVGRAGTDPSLAERIRSWFGADAALSFTTERELAADRVLGPHPARGVAVWVTLRTDREARLYFAAAGESPETTRYLIRDVPLDDGLDEIGSERVAQVVHSSVTALVEDSVEAIARPELERELAPETPATNAEQAKQVLPPHPADDVHPSASSGPSLTPLFGAFYRGAWAGDEGIAHGPGIALGATLGFDAWGVGLVGRGHYVWPRSERFDDIALTLSELSARLGARGVVRTGGPDLDLELGGGAAWVRFDPDGDASGPVPAPRGTDERFFWFASLGVGWRVGPIRAGGRFELELYPARSHYELDTGQEVAASSRYRPALVFEIVLD